jgi:hypothetical protein
MIEYNALDKRSLRFHFVTDLLQLVQCFLSQRYAETRSFRHFVARRL